MTLRAGLAKLVGAALAGSLLFVVAPAAAKPCHQQGHGPGNSEISQYLENVPGPCGDQGIPGNSTGGGASGGGGGGGSASNLPPGAVEQLNELGAAGAATARFAEATSPVGGAGESGSNGSDGSGSGGATVATDSGDGSALSALGNLIGGGSDEGIGTFLPILLGAIFLGGLGFVALRRGYNQ